MEVFRYGPFPSNVTDVYPAAGDTVRGTVALLHGGWWRARHDRHLMDGLCEALSQDGWRVGNVEFRRTGAGDAADEGGWPRTFDDVSTALRKRAPVPAGLPTIAVGHSAGGHLALLAARAGLVDAAVALAPITDLVRCHRDALGEGATEVFMGSGPESAPEAYRAASPIAQLPIGRPQLVVHGDQDGRVPVEQSRAYVARARSLGDHVDYLELPGVDHFAVIDAHHRAWSETLRWIDDV